MAGANPVCGCICNEASLGFDSCCRCIPLELCVALIDEYGGIQKTELIVENNKTYSGSISCEGETASVFVELMKNADDICVWRVQVYRDDYDPVIDQSFVIEGEGAVTNCTHPQFEVDSPFTYCSGKLVFSRYSTDVLPAGPDCHGPYCGSCRCVCITLCVTKTIAGMDQPVEEWVWNPDTLSWGSGEDSVALLRDEYSGECIALVPGFDPVSIGDCADGLGFSVEDEYGTRLVATCKKCQCISSVFIPCCDRWMPKTLYVSVQVWPPPSGGTLPPGDEGVDCSCKESLVFPIVMTAFDPAVGAVWEGEAEIPCPSLAGPCKITVYLQCLASSNWETLTQRTVTVVSCDPLLLYLGYDPDNHDLLLMSATCCGQVSTLSQGYYLVVTE
ncbi:MAG: hypothetical protein KDA85_08925 [Planctomycetaceae bacterium]|nr:hypothetical protein [Planctomycetaceae bacterium]